MFIAQTREKTMFLRTDDNEMAQRIVGSFLKDGEEYSLFEISGDIAIIEEKSLTQYTLLPPAETIDEVATELAKHMGDIIHDLDS